jgi:hypothetical protein
MLIKTCNEVILVLDRLEEQRQLTHAENKCRDIINATPHVSNPLD